MTEAEYWQKVNFVCETAPNHPLVRKLTEAYSAINVMYLKRVLNDLVDPGDDRLQPKRKPKRVKLVDSDDITLRKLYIRKSSLFTDRAKLSNSFHECRNDKQRAQVSDEVQLVQKAIASVMNSIRHYEENGCLPQEDERYPIPKNPIELAKKLNSIRARISQIKKDIDRIAELPKQHKDRDRLDELASQLDHMTKYRGHVETAVKEASVQ